VGGPTIGAALAEVDSHCVESGQSAEEAFGDPAAYARGLGLPGEDESSPRALLWSAAPILVQVLGMLLLLPSFAAWRTGALAQFSVGEFVNVGLLILLVAAAIRWIDVLLRTVIRRPFVAWAIGVAPLVLFVASPLLFPTNALQVPPAGAIMLSVVLLVAGTGWSLAAQRADVTDIVVAPLATATPTRATPGLVRILTVGMVPIATAGLLVLSWRTTR
jgi:hypothetical protein